MPNRVSRRRSGRPEQLCELTNLGAPLAGFPGRRPAMLQDGERRPHCLLPVRVVLSDRRGVEGEAGQGRAGGVIGGGPGLLGEVLEEGRRGDVGGVRGAGRSISICRSGWSPWCGATSCCGCPPPV
jgi:hypothetical protein